MICRSLPFCDNFIYLFFFVNFCLLWVFVALSGLSLVAVRRGYFVAVCGLLIATASLVEHRLWGALAGSVVAASGL